MPRKPPSLKQRQQEYFSKVYMEALAKGEKRIPPGPGWAAAMDRLHQRATLIAHEALDEFVAMETVLSTPIAVEGSSNTLPYLKAPVYAVPKLPPAHNIFKDVVMGENEKAFRFLELIVNTMREQAETIPVLLVGPPSVGKTMTAEIIARAVERPFLPLSASTMGSKLFKVVEGPLAQIHGGNPFKEIYAHPDNRMPVSRINPTTIFIDEAHELHASVQTVLLDAMEKPFLVPKPDGGYLDFRDVLFLGGTTDPSAKGSSGLVKPLRTRFTEVTFVHYGVGSVAKIVRRHYPRISRSDSEILARTAKLYPRTALRYAKQAGSMPMRDFIRDYLGANELGLDALDQRILALLEENLRPRNPIKVAEAKILLEQHAEGGRVTPVQMARARAILEAESPKAIGISALASKLMVTDLEDIQARVHYLETLGLVTRTSQGVVRTNQESRSEGAAGPVQAVNDPLQVQEGSASVMGCRTIEGPPAATKRRRFERDSPLPLEKAALLQNTLHSLESRDVKQLRMITGEGGNTTEHILEEVGTDFPSTRARIRSIEQKAAKKILRMAKKPTVDDPLFGAAIEILDSLKAKEGAHAGKVKVGTSLPMPIYEFMRPSPG